MCHIIGILIFEQNPLTSKIWKGMYMYVCVLGGKECVNFSKNLRTH